MMLGLKRCIMPEAEVPFIVELTKPTVLKEGDVFNVWGQYQLCSSTHHNGKKYVYAVQLNDINEHVFNEPFIDYGQFDR